MATIGLKNIYRALVTETDGAISYGAPKKMNSAISAELSVEFAEGTLYGDDSVDTSIKEFASGELSLNVADLTPDEYKELLGQTQDSDGVNYAGSSDAAPYWAIGFQARRHDGKYRYVWLYKVLFAVPEESYNTNMLKICSTYGVSEKYILNGEDGMYEPCKNVKKKTVNDKHPYKMNKRIKDLRQSLGLTQAAFASKCNISQTAIASYEVGTRKVSAGDMIKLCATFNVSEEYIRSGEDGIYISRSPAKEKMTDEQRKLAEDYVPYTQAIVKMFFGSKVYLLRDYDIDDFVSCGYIGLCNAAKKFKGEGTAKFSTFAFPFICGEVKNLLCRKNKSTQRAYYDACNLENAIINSGKEPITLLDCLTDARSQYAYELAINAIDFNNFLQICRQQLSDVEKECLNDMLNELSSYESANRLQLTMGGVHSARERVQKKLRKVAFFIQEDHHDP